MFTKKSLEPIRRKNRINILNINLYSHRFITATPDLLEKTKQKKINKLLLATTISKPKLQNLIRFNNINRQERNKLINKLEQLSAQANQCMLNK